MAVEGKVEFHCSDFDWIELLSAGVASHLETDLEEEGTPSSSPPPSPPPSSTTAPTPTPTDWDDGASWELFHARHGGAFFHPRRYLTQAFPALTTLASPDLGVLEVGCGSGKNLLPMLSESDSESPSAPPPFPVFALDVSASALEHFRRRLEAELPAATAARVTLLQADIATGELPPAIPAASMQAVLMVFTLSALPRSKHVPALRACARALAPGGLLLLRDYGLLDHAHRRFDPSARVGHRLFRRGDGTLAYFFSVESVKQLCATVGLVAVTGPEWHTVSTTNRRKGTTLKRVFVNGVFRKEGPE